jgi:hypothetical protein
MVATSKTKPACTELGRDAHMFAELVEGSVKGKVKLIEFGRPASEYEVVGRLKSQN